MMVSTEVSLWACRRQEWLSSWEWLLHSIGNAYSELRSRIAGREEASEIKEANQA
jgi:hypothetical protein